MTQSIRLTVVAGAIVFALLSALVLPNVASAFGHFQPRTSISAWSNAGEVSISGDNFEANTFGFADAWVSDSFSAEHGSYYSKKEAYGSASQSVHVSGYHTSVYTSGVSAGAYISR